MEPEAFRQTHVFILKLPNNNIILRLYIKIILRLIKIKPLCFEFCLGLWLVWQDDALCRPCPKGRWLRDLLEVTRIQVACTKAFHFKVTAPTFDVHRWQDLIAQGHVAGVRHHHHLIRAPTRGA